MAFTTNILASADSLAAGIISGAGMIGILLFLTWMMTEPDRKAKQQRDGRRVRLIQENDQLKVYIATKDNQQEAVQTFPLSQAQAADAYQQQLLHQLYPTMSR